MVAIANEDIASLVLDIGTSSIRAGHGGEDTPRVNLNTTVGKLPGQDGGDEDSMDVDQPTASASTLLSDHLLNKPRAHMTMAQPITNGSVTDWDAFEKLVEHALIKEMGITPSEFPLFMVESVNCSMKHREKLCELAFEKWQCPAAFVHHDAVTAAFANGRPNALVVDVGASGTRVTPIFEGYVLRKAAKTSPWGGDAVTTQLAHLLKTEKKIKITPRYLVQTKRNVDLNRPSEAILRQLSDITPSFHQYHINRCLDDLKQAVCMASETTYHELALAQRPHKPYEFPDGFNTVFGTEKYRAVEAMFDPAKYYVPGGDAAVDTPLKEATPLVSMIRQTIDACDVDIRPHLVSNIVITGGSSLFPYLTERLNFEISREFPSLKVRAVAAGSTVERKFASWIGGSVLASLGTFQQLWLSKEEYTEHGASIVEKRLAH